MPQISSLLLNHVIILIIPIIAFFMPLNAWEDHPDKEDHRETDRLFRECQRITGADKYEAILIEKRGKEETQKLLPKKKKDA